MAIDKINQMAKKFPVLVITGPRQSGKTTICKHAFPGYRYVTLENPDDKAFAMKDPRSFLAQYDAKVIFDEAQNVPELFSYLQERVDNDNISGQYILSGSQNFMLMEKISQKSHLYALDNFSAEKNNKKLRDFYFRCLN